MISTVMTPQFKLIIAVQIRLKNTPVGKSPDSTLLTARLQHEKVEQREREPDLINT